MQARRFIPDPMGADAQWVLAQHAAHYPAVEGFDDSFAPLVAQLLQDFCTSHDRACEAGFVLQEAQGARLGSLFLTRDGPDAARLQLFYLIPAARGTGAAQLLFDTACDFARESGYERVVVSSYRAHAAAARFYVRNGLCRSMCKSVHSFGCNLVEEHWQKPL